MVTGLYALSFLASADTIKGEITFIKSPAKAGVIYEVKQNFKAVSGTINQQGKKFTEMLGVASPKGELELKNNDEFEHNIFANDTKQNVQFDVGLMQPGSSQSLMPTWEPNTLVRIGCKIHPKMRSYIANIPSDNYLGFEFEKKIKNIPFELNKIGPNSTHFMLLLAGMDSVEIQLNKGESKTFKLTRKGKDKGSITISRT